MSRYTGDSRDRVRDAVDMLALVGARVELTQRGRDSYFGRCPFHDERTPSFHVRPDEKHYHCFGCSESGDPFDFVMATEGLDFKEALELLADRFGVQLEAEEESPQAAAVRHRRERIYSLLGRVTAYYERYFWGSTHAGTAREYLLGRGLSEQTLREFRIGYAPAPWDRLVMSSLAAGYTREELLGAGLARPKRGDPDALLDRFRGRIMFPTCDSRGRVIGFGARILAPGDREAKYINTAEGDVYHKRAVLYGIDRARGPAAKAGRMVLAEGYVDVMALHQAGVVNAVGIMGTSLTSEQVAELVRTARVLDLCLDADNAGRQAMVRAARLCADSGLELRVVALDPGTDPGELTGEEGAEKLRECVAESRPYVAFAVTQVLAGADLVSAEGKDLAITELRSVLAELPASILRDQLVRHSARALDVSEGRLVALLGDAPATALSLEPGGSRSQPAGGSRYVAPTPVRVTTSVAADPARARRSAAQAEQAFLAMCLAAPALGAQALASMDTDALFVDDGLRRAARFLKAQLPDPLPDPPEDDPGLIVVLDQLVARAARGRHGVSADELEHGRLLLSRDQLTRELRYLREHGGGEGGQLAALSAAYQRVLNEISAVITRMQRLL